MTIIEAVKSGKRFSRRGWRFFDPSMPSWQYVEFTPEDILAEDWEVLEEKITVTKAQLEKAWTHVSVSWSGNIYLDVKDVLLHGFNSLAKELGFK